MSQVTAATYPTRAQANMAAQMHIDAGLDAVVADDDGGAIPHLTMGTDAPSVRVPADQANSAAELLDVDMTDGADQPLDEPHLERRAAQRGRRRQIAATVALVVIVIGIVFAVVQLSTDESTASHQRANAMQPRRSGNCGSDHRLPAQHQIPRDRAAAALTTGCLAQPSNGSFACR